MKMKKATAESLTMKERFSAFPSWTRQTTSSALVNAMTSFVQP